MIFLIQTFLDRAAFAACPDKEAVYGGEIARARQGRAEGRLLGLFRRADCNGSVIILDAPSHEALMAELQTLPMYRFWSHVEVLPLVAHPVHPDFATPRPPSDVASGRPLMPEGY